MMILFPDHWAHKSVDAPVIATPANSTCAFCKLPILPGSRGLLLPQVTGQGEQTAAVWQTWHRRCLLRQIIGPDLRCHECLDMGRVWIAGEWMPCLCGAKSAR